MSSDSPEGPDSGLRFETTPYKPDGGCPPLGFLLILFLGLICGVPTGIATGIAFPLLVQVVGWLPEWYLFLLLLGLVFLVLNAPLILLVRGAVRWGKVRNAAAATLAALIVWVGMAAPGLFIISTFWLHGRLAFLPPDDVLPSFIAYAVVALGTAAILVGASRHVASQPFCTDCGTWKKEHFKRKIAMPPHVLLRAVQTGDVVPLADRDVSREGPLTLSVTACPNCGLEAPAEVKLEHTTTDARGRRKVEVLTHVRYPGSAAVVLEAIFQPPETNEST